MWLNARPNKPLKLPAAGFSPAAALFNTDRGGNPQGRSSAAFRWDAARDAVAKGTG
jgi:hypothetical protein